MTNYHCLANGDKRPRRIAVLRFASFARMPARQLPLKTASEASFAFFDPLLLLIGLYSYQSRLHLEVPSCSDPRSNSSTQLPKSKQSPGNPMPTCGHGST